MVLAQPNPTLYVSNIDWKIKKPLLRRALYSLFTRHGKVLEIITLRKTGLRGQAWVVMETVQGATAALQAEAGVAFFGKDLKIGYAHHTSDRIAKRDGTYVPKAKRKNMTNDDDDAAVAPADDEAAPATTTTSPPSHIVLAQELPADATLEIIQQLFHTYPGYKEVRLPRPGLAFCEFESEPHATMALNGLQGFQLSPTHALQLDYGKA